MRERMTMNCRRSTGVLGALTALLVAAAGLPPSAGAFCNGSFFITQHGFCSISTTQACGIPSLGDAECPAGETCVNDPRVVSFINPCSPSASPPCNAGTAQARIRLDVGAGPISASPFKLTVNRLRFDLDCVGSPSLPCTEQGDIVRYLGDTTITSNCTTADGNVTWVSTTAQGGNEIVFNPTDGSGNPRPLLINQNTTPGDTTGGGCSVFFNIQVVSQEPASGPLSDNTPGEIEQIAGYTTTSNDATCAVNQPSGSQQTNNVPICPSCAVDECNQGCDQTTGTCTPKDDSTPCSDTDGKACTTAGCELNAAGVGVCVQTHVSNCQAPPLGCRITAGGVNPNGSPDSNSFAEISKGTFGGQVGAPCGCIGCFDNFDQVQGNWQYTRKTRIGNFHAMDFDSLVCGCKDLNGGAVMLDGTLCGDRTIGPTPPAAPANIACFTGVGELNPTSGQRTVSVGFRVDLEDRGEPGAGKNSAPSADVYRIRIWIPTGAETAADLAAAACCNNPNPSLRTPDIDDGAALTHGNIQIHKETPLTQKGVCPPPTGTCAAP